MNWCGKILSLFTGKNILSVKRHNAVIRALNPLQRITIKEGPRNQVVYSDENVAIQFNSLSVSGGSSSSSTSFYPFKIYQVAHPTDPTKSWRTFQVRGGIVGYRPVNKVYRGAAINPHGVYEMPIELTASGSDGCVVTSGTSNRRDWFTATTNPPYLAQEVVNVNISADTGAADLTKGAVFVLDATQDDNGFVQAAFWIEILDTVPGDFPIAQIKCRMFTNSGGDSTGRSEQPFPTEPSPGLIPLGTIYCVDSLDSAQYQDLTVQQFIDDHILNRYPPGYPVDTGWPGTDYSPRSALFYRGEWTTADSFDPLYNKVYYPGDVTNVLKTGETVGIVTLADRRVQYIWLPSPGIETVIPSASNPNWAPINGIDTD